MSVITASLDKWHITQNNVDIKNRIYDINLYHGNMLICRYYRKGDSQYKLDNINYQPIARKAVAEFVRTVEGALGDRFRENTLFYQLRKKEGYHGNLAAVAEIVLWYTRAVVKVINKAKEVPKGQYVIYAVTSHTFFDSMKINDTQEFIITHPERDQQKLFKMILDDATRNNIKLKYAIFSTAGMDWNLPLTRFMFLYRDFN